MVCMCVSAYECMHVVCVHGTVHGVYVPSMCMHTVCVYAFVCAGGLW